jgi:hypothetical protein
LIQSLLLTVRRQDFVYFRFSHFGYEAFDELDQLAFAGRCILARRKSRVEQTNKLFVVQLVPEHPCLELDSVVDKIA